MADLNEVRLIGRLTRDPELRSTPGGQYVASFGLATGSKYRGQDGVMREETTFVDITCWGKLAEMVSKYMKKGRLVFIGGKLKFESWNDKETGKKHSRLTVVALNVQFLDSKREGGEEIQPSEEGEYVAQPAPGAAPVKSKERPAGASEDPSWEPPQDLPF
jgi:single-strand DNA-binding protein